MSNLPQNLGFDKTWTISKSGGFEDSSIETILCEVVLLNTSLKKSAIAN